MPALMDCTRISKVAAASIVFLAILWFLFIHQLAERDLWGSHEARAGQNAASILCDGCWGLPKLFDGTVELQKPPLYYWLVALAAWGRGQPVDAWAVRLPAALTAVFGVLAVFGLLALRGRPLAGVIAGLILATAVHYTWIGRTGRIDMPLTASVTLALACFYLAQQRERESVSRDFEPLEVTRNRKRPALPLQIIAYASIGMALMLKGPIGAVLPASVLSMIYLLEPENRRWSAWRRTSLRWGIPLVLLIVLPWYVWADQQTGGQFLQRFFWYDNIERAFGDDERLAAYPFWFYLPRFLTDFLPWSPLLLVAGWLWWRQRIIDPEARFGLVWLLGMVLLLSLARFKRGDYLLPAYPGAALFLGCMLERFLQAAPQPRRWLAGLAGVVLVTLAGWWVYLHQVLPAQEGSREQRTFAAAIRARAPAPKHVLFFRVEAHLLAFHLGWPVCGFLEWENLDVWAGRAGEHWIVMSPECAAEWPRHITQGRLEEVFRTSDLTGVPHERELVLMRIRN